MITASLSSDECRTYLAKPISFMLKSTELTQARMFKLPRQYFGDCRDELASSTEWPLGVESEGPCSLFRFMQGLDVMYGGCGFLVASLRLGVRQIVTIQLEGFHAQNIFDFDISQRVYFFGARIGQRLDC